ncbi:unannotated protein [freshwater metagenome]|uniref:Unannotated protein n=1 Tax=freshwater metagenome TaxID=449393 RepID=A0A6J7EFR7_9ZZZZ
MTITAVDSRAARNVARGVVVLAAALILTGSVMVGLAWLVGSWT